MRLGLRGLWSRLLASCFQTRCIGCTAWGPSPVCHACAGPLPRFPDEACPRCLGAFVPCPLCKPTSPLAQVYAIAPYQGILRRAIHGVKFDARPDLADWLSTHMVLCLPDLTPDWIVIPVPLSAERFRERGYNQAEWLSRRIPGYRHAPRWLERARSTAPQVGQGRSERWDGLHDAFRAKPRVAGQRILLVDDVLTTGATLFWAAHALKTAGAREVRALVAARAQLHSKPHPPG